MYMTKLEALVERYFTDPLRQVTVGAGSVIIMQNGHNDRLYLVQSGELEGFYIEPGENKQTRIFSASHGAFIGVHSFFSGTWTASSTVIAKTDATLAWIDRRTTAIDSEQHGPLTSQFMPVIVNELSRRQRRLTQEAVAKEKALQRLHMAEQMTTLGQLAAGLAHELNNAIGVVSSKSQRLESIIMQLLQEQHPEASQFFDFGLLQGQSVPTSEARNCAKLLEQKYSIERNQAKALAKALPYGMLNAHWLNNPDEAIRYWSIGCDLHDLRLASRHAVAIVKSVKQLGRTDADRITKVNVNDTVNQALALLQSELRRVDVRLRPSNVDTIWASDTELVQVWVNIIKNACDAMAMTPEPALDIRVRQDGNKILVTIANNGPELDEATRRKIFQPNFTTKKGGLSFGLGLGLAIVRRIVTGLGGSIAVKSNQEATIFRVKLPVEGNHGETESHLRG